MNRTLRQMKIALALFSVAALSACTNQNSAPKTLPLIEDTQKIISTRPQNSNQFMAILKLKSPALLSESTNENGVTKISQELLKQIETEQQNAIAELKKISPEIQVMYKYRMVLNAICVVAPKEVFEKIKAVGFIASWEAVGTFSRPQPFDEVKVLLTAKNLNEKNSSKFIGAEKLNAEGITGKGIKVGIIDTGIDYTHAMFGGVGTEEGYKAINPSGEAVGYPSPKVVGGVDLVGTHYDSASPDFSYRIPKPDMNPLDEGGHGTHVAGTVAGLGDGGVTSYNGMAPDASLFAIKVFGAEGSTSDMVVIAGLEFSADPNGDGDLSDQLDVVNLSLGSPYGNPKILYAEALKNLVYGGTQAAISAGNSGPINYIVGAPGITTESLQVAASIDDGDHNWHFSASDLILPNETITVEAMEAATSKPVAEANVTGKFVYAGLALEDFNEELAAKVKGNVALIDRGQVTFNDKIKRAAAAGAIGAVIVNHSPGDAFKMSSSDKFEIPAIMITLDAGNKVKEAMKMADVSIRFYSDKKIEKPERIDTLTSFSSKGPRSMDGYLKPEISAPGSDIISAKMGGGRAMVQMSGTSMASPHQAGVMALVKQAMKQRGLNLTALELKNIQMGTATTISEKGVRYPVTRQGSGRVQADRAAHAELVASVPSISFGEIAIESRKSMRASMSLKSLIASDLNLSVVFEGNEFITMNPVADQKLPAQGTVALNLTFNLDATKMGEDSVREMDGWVKILKGGVEVYRVPVLAVAHRLSAVMAMDLKVESSRNDAAGAAASLTLTNANQNSGEALLFNFLAQDDRKPQATASMNADCDLQAVGYKIIEKANEKKQMETVVQFGLKTFKPMTTWNSCDFSILIDGNNDGLVDQELLGSTLKTIPGQASEAFASTLLDAAKAREIRKEFEAKVAAVINDPAAVAKLKEAEKYDEALIDQRDFVMYNNSTVVVVEVAADKLTRNSVGELVFKVVASHNEQSSAENDDYLGAVGGTEYKVSLAKENQAFMDLAESVTVAGDQTQTVDLVAGSVEGKLLALFPHNKFSFADNVTDAQSQILSPMFQQQRVAKAASK